MCDDEKQKQAKIAYLYVEYKRRSDQLSKSHSKSHATVVLQSIRKIDSAAIPVRAATVMLTAALTTDDVSHGALPARLLRR